MRLLRRGLLFCCAGEGSINKACCLVLTKSEHISKGKADVGVSIGFIAIIFELLLFFFAVKHLEQVLLILNDK